METNPPSEKQGKRIGLFTAVIGMTLTFFLGVYVGFHPNWIPIKGTTIEDFAAPIKHDSASDRDPGRAATAPTTAATTQPSQAR